MIIKRLLLLQLFLFGGLGSLFLLPRPQDLPAGVKMQLPEFLGSWYGQDAAVTAAEKEVLGPGTEFARKIYTDGNGDQLYVSIVLSGPDMMTSIHRPERCLPAQGWSLLDSRAVPIRMPKPESGVLDVTRLHDLQYARNQARDTIKDRNGQPIPIYNLNYYWFIGSRETCASHYARLYVDMRDRILHGYNQRWAYVTVVSNVTKNLQPFGKDETQTDAMIQDFIKQLAPVILQPSIRLN